MSNTTIKTPKPCPVCGKLVPAYTSSNGVIKLRRHLNGDAQCPGSFREA